jgi:uncharacterized membrane protein SirB2
MFYETVKAIHVGAVALSGLGFFLRGLATLRRARWVQGRLARVLPHTIDTVLLASAVSLAWVLRLPPLSTPWLGAKILGLLAYIGLGTIALRFARSAAVRAAAWAGALLVFSYIVSVAVSKDPQGWFPG